MDSRSMKHGTQDALPRILKDIELKQAAQTGESLAFKLLLQRIGHQISVCLWTNVGAKKQIGWCRNVQITGNFGGKKTRFDGTRPHHPYPFGIGLFP